MAEKFSEAWSARKKGLREIIKHLEAVDKLLAAVFGQREVGLSLLEPNIKHELYTAKSRARDRLRQGLTKEDKRVILRLAKLPREIWCCVFEHDPWSNRDISEGRVQIHRTRGRGKRTWPILEASDRTYAKLCQLHLITEKEPSWRCRLTKMGRACAKELAAGVKK